MLEFAVATANPDASVAAFLSDKRMLLVLDNCEHMVDAVAPLLETILRRAPNVSCLVTSREALRAEGEWVYRLRPIETPPETDTLTAAEALRFGAVQLFVERSSPIYLTKMCVSQIRGPEDVAMSRFSGDPSRDTDSFPGIAGSGRVSILSS